MVKNRIKRINIDQEKFDELLIKSEMSSVRGLNCWINEYGSVIIPNNFIRKTPRNEVKITFK